MNVSLISDVIRRFVDSKTLIDIAKEFNVSPKMIKRLSLDENAPPSQQSTLIRKQQVNLTVQQKRDIVEKLEARESTQTLAHIYNVVSSTIRRIKSRKSGILKRTQDLEDGHEVLSSEKIRVEVMCPVKHSSSDSSSSGQQDLQYQAIFSN